MKNNWAKLYHGTMIYVIIIKIIANQTIINLKSLVEQSESSETVSRYTNKSLNFRSGQIDVTRKESRKSNVYRSGISSKDNSTSLTNWNILPETKKGVISITKGNDHESPSWSRYQLVSSSFFLDNVVVHIVVDHDYFGWSTALIHNYCYKTTFVSSKSFFDKDSNTRFKFPSSVILMFANE